MMRNLKTLFTCIFIIFLTSCGTIKEGFENKKKSSSDEFMVKKKSPLVMPPEYNKLPLPKNEKNKKNLKNDNIKLLIKSMEKKDVDTKKVEVDENFEKAILKKIKND